MGKQFKEDINALLHFYLNSDLEDEESVYKYLEEEGIDLEETCTKLEKFLNQKKAELLKEEGREFSQNFIKLLVEEVNKNKAADGHVTAEKNFALAFRKRPDSEETTNVPEETEAKKMELIRIAKEKGTKN